MSEFSDLRETFPEENAAVGFWIPIRATSQASPPVVTDTLVRFGSPDSVMQGAQLSKQHEIKYRTAALPGLLEGDRIDKLDEDGNPIAGEAYKVRQPPFVTDNLLESRDGYWRHALLTKL